MTGAGEAPHTVEYDPHSQQKSEAAKIRREERDQAKQVESVTPASLVADIQSLKAEIGKLKLELKALKTWQEGLKGDDEIDVHGNQISLKRRGGGETPAPVLELVEVNLADAGEHKMADTVLQNIRDP